MSFDIKISKGDIALGSDGDFEQVQDVQKLSQDILKLLQTPLGSNVFFPWYGSILTDIMIGQVLDQSITIDIIRQQIQTNLETLQKMQRQQVANGQKVTPGELLAAIQTVDVTQSLVDPTRYTIIIKVITKGFRTSEVSIDVNI